MLIIILCHWTGNIYNFIANLENMYGSSSWLHVVNKFDSEWQVRYIEGFYWGIATFLLVGSKGDTFVETVFCIVVLLITIGLFAYIISTIGQIMEDLSRRGR